jgi:preprotein translocase subunit SecE
VQDAAQVTETVATSVGDEPVAKASSKNGSTSTSTAASRAASKASAKPEEGSKWQQLINTDRFEGLRKFIRETWAEIKKVIWPDRETTRNLTLVVIAVSVVLGILLGGIDYVLFQLFEALP